jgi:hypothetical protein
MTTECNQVGFEFHPLNQRQIRAQFDGGAITSDGGGLLLREVDKRIGIIRQFAACFTDYRNPERIEHKLEELVAQWVYGLALGYEDLNDHDQLRKDPLLAVLVEKSDEPTSAGRQEHLESTGANQGHGQLPGALQENCIEPWGGGPPVGGSVSAGAPASAGADHSGSGCNR